ncbi:LOW QUALITY PROTEIN: protein spartin [Drosophila ficusphila]|uniref:LOW QUALITY PROTEIN: protein spartin n=1 Tax=Drosophila ficusphila TaxID=30025 RepID=UPI0007E5CFB6|nr:LOW QUALITY PROTEIN: protein spartin [Drosophila ficusphila]
MNLSYRIFKAVMSEENEFLEAYAGINAAYKAAMAQVEIAVSHEEQESQGEALEAYELALKMIEDVFGIPVGLPDDIDAVQTEWNDACALIQKLKSAKTEISYRLKVLRSKNQSVDHSAVEALEDRTEVDGKRPLLAENPCTHYDIANASGSPKTYRELAAGLRDLLAVRDSHALLDELFRAQAKLYRIEASGTVTSISGSSTMSLVMCTVGGKWKYLSGIYFIQCTIPDQETGMIWLYPLVPSVSNCYQTEYGAFIFPDMECQQPGNAFGLMLTREGQPSLSTEEELQDLQQFFLDLLEAVLAGSVEQLKSPTSQRASIASGSVSGSEQVSRHIVSAADFIARNLVKGAEKTGGFMLRSTPYLISKMSPASADAPTQVPSSVQTSVEVAQKVTHAAAGMTGWIAGKVGTASVAVGRCLAPHIQEQGSKLLQKGFGYDSSEANSTMEGALTIAAGAVEGVSTVFDGLETSAKILGTSLSHNSVKIIEHKYGQPAGNLASGTFDTVGNVFVVSQNVNYITPKGIAKKMVKRTGEAVVSDYKRDLRKSESHYINAGALYPDLRALKE